MFCLKINHLCRRSSCFSDFLQLNLKGEIVVPYFILDHYFSWKYIVVNGYTHEEEKENGAGGLNYQEPT